MQTAMLTLMPSTATTQGSAGALKIWCCSGHTTLELTATVMKATSKPLWWSFDPEARL